MKNIFDEIIDRHNTGSEKWDGVAHIFGTADVLPMWVADMDFSAPPAVVEAIRARAVHGVYGYAARGEGFYQSAVDWLQTRHGWRVDSKWLSGTAGVVTAMSIAIRALTEPGDKILIQTPVYPRFFSCVTQNGRQLVENALQESGGRYVIDFAQLEKELAGGVKLMILCSPHNPVGRVWTRDELMKLGELCLRYGVLVISDEIHCDLVLKGNRHSPFAALSPELADITVTCISPSKTFNIAGLATSLTVISNDGLRGRYEALLKAIHVDEGNIFGIIALEAAYRHGAGWLDSLLDYLEGNAKIVADFVAERIPAIKTVRPEATYLAWLDCRALGIPPRELNDFFVRSARVGLSDGRRFGAGGQGFMRLNFGCPRAVLREGLERLVKACR
jgi:cystathionine beta-lyase